MRAREVRTGRVRVELDPPIQRLSPAVQGRRYTRWRATRGANDSNGHDGHDDDDDDGTHWWRSLARLRTCSLEKAGREESRRMHGARRRQRRLTAVNCRLSDNRASGAHHHKRNEPSTEQQEGGRCLLVHLLAHTTGSTVQDQARRWLTAAASKSCVRAHQPRSAETRNKAEQAERSFASE